MGRLTSTGVRSLATIVALLIAVSLTQRPALAAPAITVSPGSGAVGTPISVSGTGFPAGQTVTIFFGSAPEAVVTATGGTFTSTFNVPNVSTGPVTITASGAASTGIAANLETTTFTVTAPVSPLTVQKLVTVNGLGYGTTNTARPGDQLTYQISVTNNTAAAIGNPITVSDQLAAGQTPFTSPSNCTSSVLLVTCTTTTPLAAGSTATFYFTTVVNSGFNGVLSNTAYASASGIPSTASNTTQITVGNVVVTGSSLQLCGVVTAFAAPNATTATNGSVTVSGITLPIAVGATFSGAPVVVGGNLCLDITRNSTGAVSSVATTLNLTGLGLVCGVYGPSSTAGTILVAGVPVMLTSTGMLSFAVPGTVYCFVINGSGQIYAVLSTIPTAITAPHARIAAYRGAALAD